MDVRRVVKRECRAFRSDSRIQGLRAGSRRLAGHTIKAETFHFVNAGDMICRPYTNPAFRCRGRESTSSKHPSGAIYQIARIHKTQRLCTGDLSSRPHLPGAHMVWGDMICRPYNNPAFRCRGRESTSSKHPSGTIHQIVRVHKTQHLCTGDLSSRPRAWQSTCAPTLLRLLAEVAQGHLDAGFREGGLQGRPLFRPHQHGGGAQLRAEVAAQGGRLEDLR